MDLILNKIKNKENMPVIMFFIVLINYLPLFINNAFTKEAQGVSMRDMVLFFLLEIVLLSIMYLNNKKNIKIIKNDCIIGGAVFIILFIVQLKNLLQKNFYIMDIFNIGCTVINILFFYIINYNFKISEEKFVIFLKGIIWIGIASIIWNCILFYKEVLIELGFPIIVEDNNYLGNIKSFFSNRNSCAFFLYLSLISNIFIINIDNKKIFYNFSILVILFGIWVTHSKTGFGLSIVFLELYILLKDNCSLKKKIALCIIVAIIGIVGLLNIMGYIFVNDSYKNLVSLNDVKRLSGRTDIWKVGIKKLCESPLNIIFGIGRFNSTHILKFKDRTFTQFHNVYLDILLTGGMVELSYIVYIYIKVLMKIYRSDLKKSFKIIYYSSFLTYFMYIMLESCGRFSIGCVDTVCITFFVAIPLLHSNSEKIWKDEKRI